MLLSPAVFQEVIKPHLAVAAGFLKRDRACLQQPARVVREIRSKSAASSVDGVKWCGAASMLRSASFPYRQRGAVSKMGHPISVRQWEESPVWCLLTG